MNGNSSLGQLFAITEKAMKEWNHSIDFNHSHKFIETEFSYPKIANRKIVESLILVTNLCVLEEKGFDKDYENLIKANTIGKAVLGLANFLKNSECDTVRASPQGQAFITASFHFVKKCLPPATEAENIIKIYCSLQPQMSV